MYVAVQYLSEYLLSNSRRIEILKLKFCIILSEIVFLLLRQEHRLNAYENKLLRRVFCPKEEEEVGGGGGLEKIS